MKYAFAVLLVGAGLVLILLRCTGKVEQKKRR